jgi:hypothetical protein
MSGQDDVRDIIRQPAFTLKKGIITITVGDESCQKTAE